MYKIDGMSCKGCASSVTEQLSSVEGVNQVEVSLERAEAKISMTEHIPLQLLKSALSDEYSISEKLASTQTALPEPPELVSKWQQLKPLFLIFFYLFATSLLLNFRDWDTSAAMLDFMGLFFIVFSFFKLLDLKGFPDSFRMYDPLAKAIPAYAWVYPFIEVALGLMFLMRFQLSIALISTIVILGITTIGVAKTLLDKKSIRCACLGTALKLPMTEATLIENTIMLVMAFAMLFINFA